MERRTGYSCTLRTPGRECVSISAQDCLQDGPVWWPAGTRVTVPMVQQGQQNATHTSAGGLAKISLIVYKTGLFSHVHFS